MTTLTTSLAPALARILDGLELQATREQQGQLLEVVAMLQRWNGTYNLTSVREPRDMLSQHVADCLAVIKPLDRMLVGRPTAKVLDVGSGAGFPGSVIAVMRPKLAVTCIDSVGKKAAFIRQVAGQLAIANLVSAHGRVQDLKTAPFDVIASRALSELRLFTQLTAHLLGRAGMWMAMKGKVPEDEIAAFGDSDLTFHVEQLKVPALDAARCLVWITPSQVSPS